MPLAPILDGLIHPSKMKIVISLKDRAGGEKTGLDLNDFLL